MLETYIYAIIFFIVGIIMGSFYNVVGYRLPNNMSIAKPPSHCPTCNKRLKFLDLIPIFSYIFLGGKCRYCKTKIAIFYPIVELITGLIFVLSYLVFGMTMEMFVAITFSSTLIIVMISDFKYMIIPDELLIFSGILLFVERLSMSGDIITILLDAVIPFVILFLIKLLGDALFKKESLGGGDIKLMVIFGLVIGWELSILSIFVASFIALPISLIILLIKKTNIISFGPYLSLAALLLYFFRFDISILINAIIG